MSAEQKSYPSQLEKVKAITDQLEAGIQSLFESEKFKQYLKTLSKFHNYSLNNTLLIAMQKPDATLVAGYTTWKRQFGRQVRKGANGIRILAHAPYKKKIEVDKTDTATGRIVKNPDGTNAKETQEVLMPAFKVVNVFDVSQTDGKPLPTIGVNELTGDVAQYDLFFKALTRACPVPIEFEQIENGDYSFAYVAGWSHGKELPELRASLDKIRTTASEMITEIDSHLADLHQEYVWAHLTAADVKHIECIGSEYMPLSRMAEHTFSCEIAGEAMTLKLHLSQHDDGEGFTIHSEGKDIWEAMPESELRRLEPVLTSAAELHYWTPEVEQAETIQAVKDAACRFMEDETLGLSREQCQRFWTVIEQKEAEFAPPSALADLQAKKAKAEKEKPSKHARNKQKMQEEAR